MFQAVKLASLQLLVASVVYVNDMQTEEDVQMPVSYDRFSFTLFFFW